MKFVSLLRALPLWIALTLLMPERASADGEDLQIFPGGPTYAQAGSLVHYEFKVVNNTTSETFSNLEVWNDIPSNVSYVSGGEFFEQDTKFVLFRISSLAPRSEVWVSWVGRAANGLAVNSVITNSSFGLNDPPADTTIGYGSGASTRIDVIGTLESVYKDVNGVGFNVEIDSFGFQNFLHASPVQVRNFSNDLLPEDLFRLFGPDVYTSDSTPEKRKLTGPAQTWLKGQITDMNLGVCEGMAAASLRLFNWEPFKGYSSPASIQSGATTAVDLDFPGEVVENYVCYYYNTQYANEVYNSQIYGSAKETITTLTTGWAATTPIPYTLAIFVLKDGKLTDGHAIAPYGIEKVSETEKRILVYDNNFPKQRQYITVNTTADSWRYVTAATPGEGDSIYEGSGSTNKLVLTPNKIRDNADGTYFTAPFSHNATSSAESSLATAAAHSSTASVLETTETRDVILSYIGEGAYLVVNEAGQATGFETDTGNFINEIPGATVIHHRGGLGLNVPPRIIIPFSGPDETYYSVFVHGQTDGNVTDGSLHITGPGFIIGVNDISLDPFDEFEFSFSPDGDHISFTATEEIEAPELFIAHDPVHPGDPSIIFDIEGVVLLPEEKVMIDLDPILERVHFNHTGPEAENFDIDIRHIWPDGDEEDYDEMIHLPAGTQSAFIDFGAWDGLLEPPLFIDGILQNPSIDHRLTKVNSTSEYDPTPQPNAPAGVYRLQATFRNMTEVSVSDIYFNVTNLGDGDVLLNADAGSADGRISVPAEALGADGILHGHESFTVVFEVGLADSEYSELTFDAAGLPHDWIHPDPLSLDINLTEGVAQLCWNSQAGVTYQVESRSSLGDDGWTVVATVSGEAGTTCWTDTDGAGQERYYRLVVQ